MKDIEESSALDLEGKRAVIVEDQGLTQLQLKRMLRKEGMEVVGTAGNGVEAIETVLETRPDVVLMDINMPVMNGLDASRHILAEYPVCIVVLTAYSEEEYTQQAEELGVCGYVLKPITKETLLPQLRKAFETHQPPKDEGKEK